MSRTVRSLCPARWTAARPGGGRKTSPRAWAALLTCKTTSALAKACRAAREVRPGPARRPASAQVEVARSVAARPAPARRRAPPPGQTGQWRPGRKGQWGKFHKAAVGWPRVLTAPADGAIQTHASLGQADWEVRIDSSTRQRSKP